MNANKEKEKLRKKCNVLKNKLSECTNEKEKLERERKSVKRKINWKAIGIIVQIFVVVAIFMTVYYSKKNIEFVRQNIEQQGEFNRSSLNPWLYITPIDSIYIKEDTLIVWRYFIKCIGRTPGLKVKTHSLLNTQEKSHFIDLMYDDKPEEDVVAYLFPNEKLRGGKSRKLSDLKLSKSNFPEEISHGLRLFYHLYILYQDFNRNEYYFGGTFKLKNLKSIKDREIWHCTWTYCDSYYGKISKKRKNHVNKEN